MQFSPISDKTKSSFNKERSKNTSFAAATKTCSPSKSSCPLKDGEHKVWQCSAFKKLKIPERHEVVKKANLCFSCLSSGHRKEQCKFNKTCGKDGCTKRHNRLLHSEDSKTSEKQVPKKAEAEVGSDAVLTANSCSGSLQIAPLRLSHGNKSCDTLAICDTGSTLSFVDKELRNELCVTGTASTLNIAGINGTKEMTTAKVKLQVSTPDLTESVIFHVHPQMYLGNKSYVYQALKKVRSLRCFAKK